MLSSLFWPRCWFHLMIFCCCYRVCVSQWITCRYKQNQNLQSRGQQARDCDYETRAMAEKSHHGRALGPSTCHLIKWFFFPLEMVRVYEASPVSCLEVLSDKQSLCCAEKQILSSFPHDWIFKMEHISHSSLFSYLFFYPVFHRRTERLSVGGMQVIAVR